MRKKRYLLCVFMILSFIGTIIFFSAKTKIQLHFDEQSSLILTIHSNGREIELFPYENPVDGQTYFFLPAYVEDQVISIKKPFGITILINGSPIDNRHELLLQDDKIYQITVAGSTGNPIPSEYQVSFMKSANLPAIFIDTQSGSMEYLNSDKENKESGQICIIKENGSLEYSARLESISGRGNSTWGYDKKPYSIKLQNSKALLGMESGKKWYLLPVFIEKNRMNSKIALDIASELGLAFTSECTWADLYLNGEYAGNYLLCEALDIGDGRIEIHNLEAENKANNPDIDNAPPLYKIRTRDTYFRTEKTLTEDI